MKKIKKKKIFVLATLGLCCYAWVFSSFGKQGLPSSGSVWVSRGGGFSCCGAQALGVWVSIVVVHGLSCPVACGVLPGQGLNPCPLHWQAGFLISGQQGSPEKD